MTDTPTVNRWFVRCSTCLAVSAVDEHPRYDWRCGLCEGQLENMGRVEKDRLVHERLDAICDDRCTSARGPACTCHCGGKYHGSHLWVKVVRDAGPVPTVTPKVGRDQARIYAQEFTTARAAVRAQIDVFLARKDRGEFLPSGDYARLRELQAAMRKAAEAREHRSRMKTLRAVLPAGTLTPIQEFAQAITTAPALAEAPFSLTHEVSTRKAKQTSLF